MIIGYQLYFCSANKSVFLTNSFKMKWAPDSEMLSLWIFYSPGPNLMALLTTSELLTVTEAGSFTLTISIFPRLAEFLMRTLRYFAFFACTARAEFQCLHSNWRMVITSAEFGRKQNREFGPRRQLEVLF